MSRNKLSVAGFTPLTSKEIKDNYNFAPGSAIGKVASHWYTYCQFKHGFYEYPTVEYVRGLASYLTARITELDITAKQPARILEVAAGRGLLSALVSQALAENDVPHTLHAVDDGSWSDWSRRRSLAEQMDFRKGLRRYDPHFVLGAWLPSGKSAREPIGWTREFRASPSVSDYLLIGKAGKHADDVDWGRGYDVDAGRVIDKAVPDYAREGFVRVDLTHLQPVQFCFETTANNPNPSSTVAFQRV